LEEQSSEHESFINRKRPALEGLVQDILGPTSILDQALWGKPVFPDQEHEFESDVGLLKKEEDVE
jgi:hypothetical protein